MGYWVVLGRFLKGWFTIRDMGLKKILGFEDTNAQMNDSHYVPVTSRNHGSYLDFIKLLPVVLIAFGTCVGTLLEESLAETSYRNREI